MIWDEANQGSQAKYPDTIVVRFVSRAFGLPGNLNIHFLDIGSGRHAPHTKFLEAEGFKVTAIDFSNTALAHHHLDIRACDLFGPETFDCVLDFNCLCHVEDPPLKKIKNWLKPGGLFFSVAPRCWQTHLADKGFCRLLFDRLQILETYSDFFPLKIGTFDYEFDGYSIRSWIIEGRK